MRSFVTFFSTIFIALFTFFASAQSASIFDPARDRQYCSLVIPTYPGSLPATLDQDFSQYQEIYQSNLDDFMHAYADYIMMLTEAATISKQARQVLKKEIVKQAKARPLTYDPQFEGRPTFHIILVMAPITIAYAQHKQDYSDLEQKIVEAWVGEKLNTILRDPYLGVTDTDNKKYFIGVWLAAFGLATSNPSYTEKATLIYKKGIIKQRADGSLINDSQRGGCAIHYTNQAVSGLVTLAEILSYNGKDLYSYRNNGKSLDTIIKFLLDATEDNRLISGYASDPEWSKSCFPGYSADRQDTSWKDAPKSVWGYYYINHFPGASLSKRLLKLSPFLKNRQVGYYANAAGNPVCFLGKFPR